MKKQIICVIPARLDSTRFPKKILANLSGKSLIRWAWEGANRTELFDKVVIAIDDLETARVIDSFKGHWIMTDKRCLTGTERLLELQKKGVVEGDIWVNWQADEPFLSQQIIKNLLQTCHDCSADIWTLKTKIVKEEEILDPNVCKVVCDQRGHALYFSRSPIPYRRDNKEVTIYRHIGLYAYSAEALRKIQGMKPCPIEQAESLEQLRFLFNGLKIQVHETQHDSLGIDLPKHLVAAEEYLKKNPNLAFN